MNTKNPLLTYSSKEEGQLSVLNYYFRGYSKKEYFQLCRFHGFKESIAKSKNQFAREVKVVKLYEKAQKQKESLSVLKSKKSDEKRIRFFRRSVFEEELKKGGCNLPGLFTTTYNTLNSEEKVKFLDLVELFSKDFSRIIKDDQVVVEYNKNHYNTYLMALSRIAKFSDFYLNPLDVKLKGSLDKKFKTLVDHLFVKYKMPRGLYSCFFGGKDRSKFFIDLAQGASFKKLLKTNIVISKKKCSLILKLMQKYPYDIALRMSQYHSLGFKASYVNAFRKINDFNQVGGVEREKLKWEFMQFVVRSPFLDPNELLPLWDYTLHRADEDENFKLLGRSAYNYLEQMKEWHESLSTIKVENDYIWKTHFSVFEEKIKKEEYTEIMQIKELTSYSSLVEEGKKQRHCVGSYAKRCKNGNIAICSLRLKIDKLEETIATIEVDFNRKAVVQAKGRFNKVLDSRSLNFINRWAILNELRMEI